jgi:hypothetical protein
MPAVRGLNPLRPGIGQICLGLFLDCPNKKPVILTILKNMYVSENVSATICLQVTYEKSHFHILLPPYLGLTQKIPLSFLS